MTAIGIDLGRENSSAAIFKDEKVQMIPTEGGKNKTPCYVTFTGGEPLVGEAAKQQRNGINTVHDVRTLIGRSLSDPTIHADIKKLPYDVVGECEMPKIKGEYNGITRYYNPEEISGMILKLVRKNAEKLTNETISNAVITVPAYFEDAQRKATEDAAKIAGIRILRLLDEPTAAAIAYGTQAKIISKRNVLVLDISRRESNATVLHVDGFIYDVKSTRVNSDFGGEDYTDTLFKTYSFEFKRQNEIDSLNEAAKLKLRQECERAKKDLSIVEETSVELKNLVDGMHFQITITRAQFEQLCNSHFLTTMEMLEEAVAEASLSSKEIDEIILVGGSTRIPRIQEMVGNYFKNRKILNTIEPDEVVARGAAIFAALLSAGSDNDAEQSPRVEVESKEDLTVPQSSPNEEIKARLVKVEPCIATNSDDISFNVEDPVQGQSDFRDAASEQATDGSLVILPTTFSETFDSGIGTLEEKSERESPRRSGHQEQSTVQHPVDGNIKISDLEKGMKLGSGGFGTVYVWKHKKTGEEIAGKEVELSSMENASDLLQEAMKIRNLSHPNIVSCFSLDTDGSKIYLFMELMKTSVANLVKNQPFAENRARAYTSDMVDGLIYLHEQGIVHKDMKGDNVLLNEQNIAKIADFGISQYYNGGTAIAATERISGTIFYLSPEVLKGGKHGKRSDVWAIGCTVFEMVTGKPPLKAAAGCKQIATVMWKTVGLEQRNCVSRLNVGVQLMGFLQSIFVDVERRPYAEALKCHDWLKGPMERSDSF